MKTTASLAVLITGLVSLTAVDALRPQDVPVECATICGPMVDLSSKCTPVTPEGGQVGDSTDRTVTGAGAVAVWAGRRADVEKENVRRFQWDADRHKRFLTIVPAPTSFDAKYSSILNPGDDPSSQLSDVTPTKTSPPINGMSDTSTPLPSPPLRPEPKPKATVSSLLSALPPRPMEAQTPSASGEQANSSDQQPPTPSLGIPTSRTAEKAASTMAPVANTGPSMDAEEQCVCFNKSFNVQRVAALCASCIVQRGSPDPTVGMQAIMSVCNFAERAYTPADNSIVDNVRVSATRPTIVLGHKAGVSNTGHGVTRGRIREPSAAVLCVLTSVLLSAM